MLLHKRLLSALCVCLFSLIAFSGMCLDATASGGTVYHSASAVADIIGDEITVSYLSTGGVYKSSTLTRNSNHFKGSDFRNYYLSNPLSVSFDNYDFVEYVGNLPDDFVRGIFTVDFGLYVVNSTSLSFYCGSVHTYDFPNDTLSNVRPYNYLTLGSSLLSSSYYYLNSGLNRTTCPNSYWAIVDGLNDGPQNLSLVGGSRSLSGSESTYCRFGEFMTSDNGQWARIFISGIYTDPLAKIYKSGGTPTYEGDPDSTATVTGTITDDSSGDGQNINITVQQDNKGLVQSILSGIRNLFVPSNDFLNGWHDDLQDAFNEHLGGISEAVSLIDEQADYLRAATSAEYIYFPELTLPIGDSGGTASRPLIGADYTLIAGHQVELRPARQGKLKVLWDFVEFAVDAVCVIAVINMLQTKYEIFLNPDGEVISYDH